MLAIQIHVLHGVSRLRTRFMDSSKGATALEYGLMASLIGAVIVLSVTTFGERVVDLFEVTMDAITDSVPTI